MSGGPIEQTTALSNDDRQVLGRLRKSALMNVPLMAILSIALLALLFVFQTPYCLVALPLFSLVALVRGLISLFNLLALSRDLRDGQKKVISGPVEAQNMDVSRSKSSRGVEGSASYRFWIQIGGKRITVSEEQYYQFKKGDVAEAFVAPHSGTVLSVNKEHLNRPFT
jgi:hypothetical protein